MLQPWVQPFLTAAVEFWETVAYEGGGRDCDTTPGEGKQKPAHARSCKQRTYAWINHKQTYTFHFSDIKLVSQCTYYIVPHYYRHTDTQLEGSLVLPHQCATYWACVLHVLHTVHTEWDEGTAGSQEHTEQDSYEEGQTSILVRDVCGDCVTVGTGDWDWPITKHNLEEKERYIINY